MQFKDGMVSGYENNLLFKLIYSFHMPLFVILSGYTLNMCTKKYDFKFLVKKFKRLIIPTIIWSYIIFFMKDLGFVGIKPFINFPSTFLEYTKALLLHPDYVIWFLCIIFYSIVSIYFLQKICKNNSKRFLCLSVAFVIILYLLPNYITQYFAIRRFKIYFPIFLLGYLVCSYKEIIFKYFYKFLIVAIIIYLAVFKFFNVIIDSIPVYYVISISAISVLYFVSRKIEEHKTITKILSFFGKYSLQIYLLQCICLNIGVGHGLFKIMTIFISATTISAILAYTTNKYKFTRVALYGG